MNELRCMLVSDRIVRQLGDEATGLSRVLVLFLLGFFTVLLGIVILVVATFASGSSASYGGVVFIGPIPIVFGAGPQATWLILFAIVLSALSIIVFFLTLNRMNKSGIYSCFSSLP